MTSSKDGLFWPDKISFNTCSVTLEDSERSDKDMAFSSKALRNCCEMFFISFSIITFHIYSLGYRYHIWKVVAKFNHGGLILPKFVAVYQNVNGLSLVLALAVFNIAVNVKTFLWGWLNVAVFHKAAIAYQFSKVLVGVIVGVMFWF